MVPPVDEAEERLATVRPQSIAAGGVDAVLFRGVELVCLVGLVIVTGRLMEPAGRGLYAETAVVAGLCGLPFGAVWIANAVEIAHHRVSLREVFGGSIVLAFAGGGVTGLIALALSPLLGDRWWLVAVPAAVTPFMLISRYEEGLYTAVGYVRAVNLMRIGRAVLPVVFIAPPLLAGASARTAITIWTLWWVALALVVFFPVRALLGRPMLPRDRSFYRRVLTYGAKMAGLNAISYLRERVGLLALAFFATDADVGVYSISVSATQVLLVTTEALALSAFQRIGGESREKSAALTARTVRHSILLVATGSALLVPVVRLAVTWTLGPGYDEVPLLLIMLIPGTISLAAILALVTFFMVQVQKPRVLVAVSGSSLVANAALTAILAPLWGARGVAIGTSAAFMLGAVVAFSRFRDETGTPLRDLRPGRRELRDYLALAGARLARWRGQS
jgi:O-antigen/teichoic acid export membrane protein